MFSVLMSLTYFDELVHTGGIEFNTVTYRAGLCYYCLLLIFMLLVTTLTHGYYRITGIRNDLLRIPKIR